MTFLDFLNSVLGLFGYTGLLLLSVVSFLVVLGVYKFVKDWLPW